MAGNSKRKGAMRNPGSKKGAVVGSGGQKSKGLQGKGPTPKAKDREGHITYKRRQKTEKAAAKKPKRTPRGSDAEWVALNTIIEERTVRDLIPRLKAARAEGIVEYPLNKIVV